MATRLRKDTTDSGNSSSSRDMSTSSAESEIQDTEAQATDVNQSIGNETNVETDDAGCNVSHLTVENLVRHDYITHAPQDYANVTEVATPALKPMSDPVVSAQADLSDPMLTGKSSSTPPIARIRKTTALRRGKWTVEEEAFVSQVIQDFNSGYLDAPAGTTLRSFLSERLQCDPMRITKKFTGDACIGKRVFHPVVRTPVNGTEIDKAQSELSMLENRWLKRLEAQQRDSAKKAAASAAAAAAVTGQRTFQTVDADDGSLSNNNNLLYPATENSTITRTASWLDRAKLVLDDKKSDVSSNHGSSGTPHGDLVREMQEVQRLINEGPRIQQTSATTTDERAASPANSNTEPADKRMRTGAEDAEALVGFLRSVRASAASGQGLF